MKKITIHGIGYVGLVLGSGLAELGNQVICLDIDKEKIDQLNQGIVPFFEPGLTELLGKNLANNRIAFSTDPVKAVQHGDYQFITVGTPPTADGSADLSYVFAASKNIGQFINKDCIVITKSTIPVGTTHKVKAIIDAELAERKANIKLGVAFNPEFLQEGNAVHNFMHPNRIIIGSEDPDIIYKIQELFKTTMASDKQFITMNICSAELTKYASNTFLAMKISFINEIANIADYLGGNINSIKEGLGADERINPYFLSAGGGYGGSCFSKDIKALLTAEKRIHYSFPLLNAIEKVNERQKHVLFYKVLRYFNEYLHDKTIAVWGLAFKPNSSDMRDAPSIILLQELWQHGAKVRVYDPEAMAEARALFGFRDDLILCTSKEDALIGADALVIVTEWQDFLNPDFQLIKNSLKYQVIFDGRNIYNREHLASLDINYISIGRGTCQLCKETKKPPSIKLAVASRMGEEVVIEEMVAPIKIPRKKQVMGKINH